MMAQGIFNGIATAGAGSLLLASVETAGIGLAKDLFFSGIDYAGGYIDGSQFGTQVGKSILSAGVNVAVGAAFNGMGTFKEGTKIAELGGLKAVLGNDLMQNTLVKAGMSMAQTYTSGVASSMVGAIGSDDYWGVVGEAAWGKSALANTLSAGVQSVAGSLIGKLDTDFTEKYGKTLKFGTEIAGETVRFATYAGYSMVQDAVSGNFDVKFGNYFIDAFDEMDFTANLANLGDIVGLFGGPEATETASALSNTGLFELHLNSQGVSGNLGTGGVDMSLGTAWNLGVAGVNGIVAAGKAVWDDPEILKRAGEWLNERGVLFADGIGAVLTGVLNLIKGNGSTEQKLNDLYDGVSWIFADVVGGGTEDITEGAKDIFYGIMNTVREGSVGENLSTFANGTVKVVTGVTEDSNAGRVTENAINIAMGIGGLFSENETLFDNAGLLLGSGIAIADSLLDVPNVNYINASLDAVTTGNLNPLLEIARSYMAPEQAAIVGSILFGGSTAASQNTNGIDISWKNGLPKLSVSWGGADFSLGVQGKGFAVITDQLAFPDMMNMSMNDVRQNGKWDEFITGANIRVQIPITNSTPFPWSSFSKMNRSGFFYADISGNNSSLTVNTGFKGSF
jgi:hypothetical protein